jgi:hypothetical protein
MPLLSRLLSAVIITCLLTHGSHCVWYRIPPPVPPLVKLHQWFISDWNKGVYPTPKRSRYKSHCQNHHDLPSPFHTTTQPCHNTTLAQACDHPSPAASYADPHTTTVIAAPECPRTLKENLHLQAHLYSLSTPGDQDKMTFGSDAENICIDTGASACISTLRANFINLRPVTKLQINGIGTGLPIEGIGTLRWALRDDKNREIDLYIKDALYVPAAPMGLLCPQQIAQQT